jgi:hypothetical protein
MTRVIGFYTDERGKVRPITSSSGWRLAEPKIEKPEEKRAKEEITLVKHPVSYEKSTKKSSMSPQLRLMQRVWVEQIGDRIAVKSPYTPQFIAKAKELGGVWDPKTETWRFPRVMEKRVRDTLYEIYGETGDGPVEVVDVRVKIDPFVKNRTSDLWIFNRRVFEAQRYGVKKDKNVAIISGELPNETLYGDLGRLRGRNIEVMIPNVPKALAERYAKNMPEEVKIIEGETI